MSAPPSAGGGPASEQPVTKAETPSPMPGAATPAPSNATAAPSMPKLPARGGARGGAASSGAAGGNGSGPGPSAPAGATSAAAATASSAATTSNTTPPATQPVQGPSGGPSGAGTSGSGSSASAPRPSAGPSLPPRQGRPQGTSASSSTSTSGKGTEGTPAAAVVSSGSGSGQGGPSTSTSSTGGGTAAAAGAEAAAAGAAAGAAGGAGAKGGRPGGGLTALPPRGGLLPLPGGAAGGPVLDPDEPPALAEVRRSVHAVRVQMIAAALRLGYDHENALVKQVLYRLNLAERLKAPWRRPGKRPDPVQAAAREAARSEAAASGSDAPLGFTVKIMLIGLQGSGKTQLAHALLGPTASTRPPSGGKDAGKSKDTTSSSTTTGTDSGKQQQAGQPQQPAPPLRHAAVHPFDGATREVAVLHGAAHGIGLTFIDTPGLSLAPGGAARNGQVLQRIRKAYHKHRPDLLVYVDRLDAPPGGAGGGAGGAGAELAALSALTAALGPALWLNTIVAFTHAGAPPPSAPVRPGGRNGGAGPGAGAGPNGGSGGPTFETWLEIRSHALQQVIRQASGDERLMNPVAFAESHPACRTNAAGQPVIHNGMPWRQHLLLMVTSAKLLADTEALLQMQGGSGGGSGAAGRAAGGLGAAGAAGAMLGMGGGGDGGMGIAGLAGPRQVPLQYLMQQVTQMSKPLEFPDHANVMDVRRARHDAARLPYARQQREAARQVALRVLALRQGAKKARAMADAYRSGTAAGCKVTPEPPRVATRSRPSATPSEGHRYRNPEAQGGWVVRPHVETHCADGSDGVEGFILNKVGVAVNPLARRKRRAGSAGGSGSGSSGKGQGQPPAGGTGTCDDTDGLTGRGVPYHHYMSAQVTKDQRLLAARSEATLYHDPLGRTTTSLAADLQTSSGLAGGGDVLAVLRSDTRLCGRQGSWAPKTTIGTILARVGEDGNLMRGPAAVGLRLQAAKKGRLPGRSRAPVSMSAAAAVLQPARDVAAALPYFAGGGGGGVGGLWEAARREGCLGLQGELGVELADLMDLPTARSVPGTLGISVLRSPEGELAAGLTGGVQYRLGAREMVGARATWGNRGRAGVSLRAKTVGGWWVGLVAMAVPLGTLARDTLRDAVRSMLAAHRLRRQRRLEQQREQQQQQQAAAAKQGGSGAGIGAGKGKGPGQGTSKGSAAARAAKR